MNFEDLKNPDFQGKLKVASTPEEIIEIVKTEGVDLTEDDLKAIAGGSELSDEWNLFCSDDWSPSASQND